MTSELVDSFLINCVDNIHTGLRKMGLDYGDLFYEEISEITGITPVSRTPFIELGQEYHHMNELNMELRSQEVNRAFNVFNKNVTLPNQLPIVKEFLVASIMCKLGSEFKSGNL